MSADLHIEYLAPPTIAAFMASDDPARMLLGPVGSGKSSGCCVEALRRCQEQAPGPDGLRRSRGAIIRNTYGQLRDTTRKTWEQWVPPELGEWRETAFTFLLAFNDVRAEILFRALDRPDHVRNLLSLELTWAYFNEAREIARPIWDMAGTRIGRYPSKKDGGASWSGVWGDTNPPDTDHWIYKLFEEERPEGHEIFRQPDGLSPDAENIENLDRCWDPKGELDPANLKRVKTDQEKRLAAGQHESPCRCYYPRLIVGKDEDFINVYARGRYGFVKEGRPVFPSYRDEMHCRPVKALGTPVLLGMDFGLTPACVKAQRDPVDGQIQVFGEVVSDSLGAVRFAQEIAKDLRSTFPGRRVAGWGDPAGDQRSQVDERTPFDVVRSAGLPVDPAPTNDVLRRLEAVNGLLGRLTMSGRPALVIDPSCRVLRKALGGAYCYTRLKVSGPERFRDAPDKNAFSHVADALQYLCVGLGEDDTAIEGAPMRSVLTRPARASIQVHGVFPGRR